MPNLLPLELLRPGEEARIKEISGERLLVCRLAEMGLREGVLVRMVRPGSPCILAIDNHRFSFRGDEAAAILVEVVSCSA